MNFLNFSKNLLPSYQDGSHKHAFGLSASRRTALAMALATCAMAQPAFADVLSANANNVLRVVPRANLVSLDPIWTTAYVTLSHGYLIYDTLFGTDSKGVIKPQMVEKWSSSADQTVWTFTLRDGLEFHDGKPVTTEDVIASLTRWSTRDATGVVMARSLDKYVKVDAKTFKMVFKQPFGLTLTALGKESGPAFIMPARVAATPGTEQIKDTIGSGPYKFSTEEYKPGAKVVYTKNTKYKPRMEAASGTAGGKNVYVDRVEWLIMKDTQTQLNALLAKEVDIIASPSAEHYSAVRLAPGINLVDLQPDGYQYSLRFNFLNPPFDNVLVRRAAMLALGQQQVLRTQVGSPGMYRYCRSLYPCGTTYESDRTGIFRGEANPKAARKLLEEAGYNGQPVVLLRPTDLASLSKAPVMVRQQLEAAGFTVDLQSMDWSALVARRAKKGPAADGGWSAFITSSAAADNHNPVTMAFMNATGQTGWFGWHDDPTLEKIKADFTRARSDSERHQLADAAQLRAIDQVTHVNLGQFNQPSAVRDVVSGLVPAGATVFWNVRKGDPSATKVAMR